MMMTHESHGCEFDTSCVPFEFLIISSYHFSNNLINKQTNIGRLICSLHAQEGEILILLRGKMKKIYEKVLQS